MDSRIPKAISSKKPTPVTKSILPTERLKANAQIPKVTGVSRPPLSRDITNISNATIKDKRAYSPELVSRPIVPRGRVRKSRSMCDLRETLKRPLKRTEPTLAPIPSKMTKVMISQRNKEVVKTNQTQTKPSKSAGQKAETTLANKIKLKRIPPYDYKARFNDLLEKHKILKEKFDNATEELSKFENLSEEYEQNKHELNKSKEELKSCQTQLEYFKRQNNSQASKIDMLTKFSKETKDALDKQTENYETTLAKYTALSSEFSKFQEDYQIIKATVKETSSDLKLCKEQLFCSNLDRKGLHNQIMDLRGNIRVFCRVRPPLEEEKDRLLCGWEYLNEESLEISNLEILPSGAKNKLAKYTFNFDQVFHPRSTQEDIFEMVSPLIQSAMDGYNVCIFAYGQTGSGKTYTMDGVDSNIGVIPRTVDLIFDSIENYKRFGWDYEVKVTFLEIYNEVLYDLLSNEQKDMEIRMCKNKSDIYVSNITEEKVLGPDRLRELMHVAKVNRATASTVNNERSSRSHAVTKIELIGTHKEKCETSIGNINLVDLAGSESPKTSTRMNETKSINKSLSELTNVILAIIQKQEHIPYRNSKLTHLLMPSLGGNSKTLMFINVSPFLDCFCESVKSLRFASSVNSCSLARAKRTHFFRNDNPKI